MKGRHTPGPWRAVATPNGWTIYAADGSEVIADFDTEEANARLIAESPAMRELLTRLVDSESHNRVQVELRQTEARALLARIDGTPTHYTDTANGRPACEGFSDRGKHGENPRGTKDRAAVTCPDCKLLIEDEPFRTGERVYWTDPDGDACSGPGHITSIEGDHYIIDKEDGGMVGAYAHELKRIEADVIAPTRTNAKRNARKKSGRR